MKIWLAGLLLLGEFSLGLSRLAAQLILNEQPPEIRYPPIARAAKVEGDVVVSFRLTPSGTTSDIAAVSGPKMLQVVALESVKGWHARVSTGNMPGPQEVTFHFRLQPPDDGYDTDGQPATRIELDGDGGIQVFSIRTTGLNRSDCPSTADRVIPASVLVGDYIELHRWNEIVRVDADGSIYWGEHSDHATPIAHLPESEAHALLERFRTTEAWGLCGDYSQGGLMDGGSSSIKLRLGGRERLVGEYGDAAPAIFSDLELGVDEAADTHRWRHGDPAAESIINISDDWFLPKPGKTRLMNAVAKGDKAAIQAALASGAKVTDTDASGWTPLMYSVGSYGASGTTELLGLGADVNARSKQGDTALMAAATQGDANEDLIDAGADVNAKNNAGTTALMFLAQRGEPDEIAGLIKAGADARAKDAQGRSALDYLNASNCGRPILESKAVQWMTVGYSTCNAIGIDRYRLSEGLLRLAGAASTRVWIPNE